MKKLFSLFLAVMMFLPALMSCGESKENTDAAENPAGSEAGTNPSVQTEPETEEDPLSDDLPWAIPKTVTDAQVDIIGTVVEALSAKNYAGVLPVYFETVMKARIADSPDDAEMLQIIADGRTISFAMQYGLEYYNTLKELIVGNKEVASYYQGKAEAAQNKLDTLIESFDEWD